MAHGEDNEEASLAPVMHEWNEIVVQPIFARIPVFGSERFAQVTNIKVAQRRTDARSPRGREEEK